MLVAPHVEAGGTPWGRMPGSLVAGMDDIGSVTSTTLNAAFNFGASGAAAGVLFSSPVEQTNGTLDFYAYCSAKTGSPTDSVAILYRTQVASNDPDRPFPIAIATSTSVDVNANCTSASWLQYSFTGVTLYSGTHYFALVTNTTATPASNNFAIVTRGAVDGYIPQNIYSFMSARTTTDGFTTDPGGVTSFPGVLKFNDGSLMGIPWVATEAHASNSNYRGNGYVFDEDVTVSCADFTDTASGGLDTIAIYQGASTVYSTTTNYEFQQRVGVRCFPQKTLTGGSRYDVVARYNPSSAGSIATMGNFPPADVRNVNTNIFYVDGATPGSFTATTTKIMYGLLFLDNNPAIPASGGGGGSVQVPAIWGF